MAGGKGKTTGGKAGPKEAGGKPQKSHSAKAGLQVRVVLGVFILDVMGLAVVYRILVPQHPSKRPFQHTST